MDEQHFFADVDLPFHVWVREGRRWVLRDASARLRDEAGAHAPRADAERARRRTSARG